MREENNNFFEAQINGTPTKIDRLVALVIRPAYESKASFFRDVSIGLCAILVSTILLSGAYADYKKYCDFEQIKEAQQ